MKDTIDTMTLEPETVAVFVVFPADESALFGSPHTNLFQHILVQALRAQSVLVDCDLMSHPITAAEFMNQILALATVTNLGKSLSVLEHEMGLLGFSDCCRIGYMCRHEGVWRDFFPKVNAKPFHSVIDDAQTWSGKVELQKVLSADLHAHMKRLASQLRQAGADLPPSPAPESPAPPVP
ncbi:MAG TPA: hypothetical protein VGO59_11940 [Verrucomicrobiae bacterium]|jgi:hypothetical protein